MEIRPGSLALCSRGQLGMITEPMPRTITYADGTEGFGWVGVHLGVGMEGKPWSSRSPAPAPWRDIAELISAGYAVSKINEEWVKAMNAPPAAAELTGARVDPESPEERAKRLPKSLRESMDDASRIVATWPEWKQNILRDSAKPTLDVPRTPVSPRPYDERGWAPETD